MTDHITTIRGALEKYEAWLAAGLPIDGGPYDTYPDDLYQAATRPVAIRSLLAALDEANAARLRAQEENAVLKERNASQRIQLMRELREQGWLSPEAADEAQKDARRYRWLRDHECNSLHLSRDGDHACNYMTASDWIDNNSNWYDEVPEEELQRMRESNTIWALQIYPHTPVGFNWWHGATLDAAIDAAIASHEAPPADGGGQSGGKTASVATKCLSGNDSSVVDGGAGQAAIASQQGGK